MKQEDTEELELDLLFQAVLRCYGYDFSHYSRDSASRRVWQRVNSENLSSISELQHLIIHNESAADALLRALSINVTEMFRDPLFYRSIRELVVPILATKQRIKIWHAGCATGEEVYSIAILLLESGLYEKSLLYATDFNRVVLEKAKTGLYTPDQMRTNTINYQKSGGMQSFADYYHSNYDGAVISSSLKTNIRFSHHNLVTDNSFGEMQMVICRNVLIYFDNALQDRVIELFAESLCDGGILCLGSHEFLKSSNTKSRFETISEEHRIFRKIG
jgi:chemotaxis protein methyltransferase CheR